ncbi:MAG: arylsulfotransferase family protein [Candidatus Thermoplasmatota archaeon]|nr:arylsulfotransferase family protein [Candidatus Thermoplasmatota archaeon]
MNHRNMTIAIIIGLLLTSLVGFNVSSQSILGNMTGLKKYDSTKSYEGYTYFSIMDPSNPRTVLIDMEGKEVHSWPLSGVPSRMLPGGSLIGSQGINMAGLDAISVVQVSWDGEVEWKFDGWEEVTDGDGNKVLGARQHHDFQREGSPVGYYSPGLEPMVYGGKTMILAHSNVQVEEISDSMIIDDVIYEVDWEGNIIKEEDGGFFWRASDHFDEMGFDDEAKEGIRWITSIDQIPGDGFEWLHLNNVNYLGPNKWYDGGDERFHPENVIIDSRHANFMAIISRETGEFVWKVGPDFSPGNPEDKLGQIIGLHHAHIIPKGLPGEGNILVFDNGGLGGYGNSELSMYSRILEFNPVTMEIVWEYKDRTGLYPLPLSGENHHFFSFFISSAQRLPNGNTLITEGTTGRIIEVTKDKEVVWEYISPHMASAALVLPVPLPVDVPMNVVYRAYRVPEDWLPENWSL